MEPATHTIWFSLSEPHTLDDPHLTPEVASAIGYAWRQGAITVNRWYMLIVETRGDEVRVIRIYDEEARNNPTPKVGKSIRNP